jgi:two-component system, sensor histidine kinase PdtaS
MPIGLIVSELIINSKKYAFPGRKEGNIAVKVEREGEDKLDLSVADDGIGMPPEKADEKGDSLGYILVRSLASQLGAKLRIEPGPGLTVKVEGIKVDI